MHDRAHTSKPLIGETPPELEGSGRDLRIDQIEFVKGPDRTAPVVMAVTVETP